MKNETHDNYDFVDEQLISIENKIARLKLENHNEIDTANTIESYKQNKIF